MSKLTELEFKTLVFQYDSIEEQIKILQKSKVNGIIWCWITVSNFHMRRKKMWI